MIYGEKTEILILEIEHLKVGKDNKNRIKLVAER